MRLNKLKCSKKDKISWIINNDFELYSNILHILNKKKFKNIIEKYKKKNIEVQTIEKLNNDLNAYHKILDQTLLKFHTEKMKKINSILEELWKTTYAGNDIDYVQIKSEGTKSIEKNRIYINFIR